MQIVVDQSRCTGLGMCESVAEDVFEVQGDGTLKLLVAEFGPDRVELMQEAVDSCPAEALRIVD